MRRFGSLALLILAAGCGGPNPSPDMAALSDQSMVAAGDAAMGSCKDLIKDGQETDVDCGGPICPACGNGKTCNGAMDCQSGNCLNNACVGGAADMATSGDMAVPTDDMAMSGDMAVSMSGDMAVSMSGDMAMPMSGDMAMTQPGDMAIGVPADMAMANPIACTFDDPNSLFDDCVVGP